MHLSAAPQVKSIRALARGLDVLKALQERPATSLHDLHGDTGLSKPTLLRILRTLEEAGMVHRAIGDGRYRVSALHSREVEGGLKGQVAARETAWLLQPLSSD